MENAEVRETAVGENEESKLVFHDHRVNVEDFAGRFCQLRRWRKTYPGISPQLLNFV
jgi:hypothetical protein